MLVEGVGVSGDEHVQWLSAEGVGVSGDEHMVNHSYPLVMTDIAIENGHL